MQRSIARRNKQVQALKLDNKKNQIEITKLKGKVNELNKEFIKEKKASNVILESGRKECAEVIATAKSLIDESRHLKRAAEEIKTKEKGDRLKIARQERTIYAKKLKTVKESMVRKEEQKSNLMEKVKLLEDNQKTLTHELLTIKKSLSLEVEKGNELRQQAESDRNNLYNERRKRYNSNVHAHNKLKNKQEEIAKLKDTVFEVTDEFVEMKKKMSNVVKANKKLNIALQKKNADLKKVSNKNEGLREYIEEEKKIFEIKELKKTHKERMHGGSSTWPLWMLQHVLESLANGTPPSSIPANILSHLSIMNPDVKIKEVPSISYIRRCRTILRIVAETLASYRLAKAVDWEQLFTDGTSRRQSAMQNLIIAIKEDGEMRNIALSSSIILAGESSEEQIDAISDMISRGGERLNRWAKVCEEKYPGYQHDIPKDCAMNIGKLSRGGTVTSDTCNAARKTRRLLVSQITHAAIELNRECVNVSEVDCWNHLRNVWLGGMTKELSSHLRKNLINDLDSIDTKLRVTPKIENILRAVDKEFSLTGNYPKGHGEIFRRWMETNHPGAILFHVERASGSRQDLCVEGAGAIYWNHKYWIEFLDQRLRIPGCDNILQENLFIILTCREIIALARVCSIIHLSICIPTRWLAGNTHKLDKYDWSFRSMGKIVDILDVVLEDVAKDGSKIMDEKFMMGIFDEIILTLPPFQEYYGHIYKKKTLKLLTPNNAKVIPLQTLRAELFSATSEVNEEIVDITSSLGSIAAAAILTEIRDPKKATSDHLSRVAGKFSWGNTSADEHEECLGKIAVNDPAESLFGSTTRQLQCFGRVSLGNAGGMGQVQANADMKRIIKDGKNTKGIGEKQGLFHMLSQQMKNSLLIMAEQDRDKVRKYDATALEQQRAAKEKKQQLLIKRGFEKASEAYIDGIYYYEMFNSQACWRTSAEVDRQIKKLKSKSAKLNGLKENIRMRVLGLGWKDLAIAWSKNGKECTVNQLLNHLKKIISQQRTRGIPEKPPVKLPERKVLPTLGRKTAILSRIEDKYASQSEKFETAGQNLRVERELAGIGDRYSQMQPLSMPVVDKKLIGKRLDVCFKWNLEEGGTELRWSQGEVVDVSDGSNILKPGARSACYKKGEAVLIRWDENKDRNEPSHISAQRLLPSKWNPKNKHSEGAWRFDIAEA